MLINLSNEQSKPYLPKTRLAEQRQCFLRVSLAIWLLALSQLSMACESSLDNPGISPLSLKQANGALNRALLNLNKSQRNNENYVANVDCYLSKQSAFFTPLTEIQLALTALGENAALARTSDQKHAAISELSQLVTRDASLGSVQFPVPGNTTMSVNLYTELVAEHCTTEPSKACGNAFDLAKKLWTIAGDYRTLAGTLIQPHNAIGDN